MIKRVCIGTGILFTLMFAQNMQANTKFYEVASIVMINSLQEQPQDSFLRKLYAQLFFLPLWIQEDGVSSFAKELFTQIKNDKTLDNNSRLYQDAVALEAQAGETYGVGETVAKKVSLEFKISQLYKGYADYTLYGSINWGAFLGRLHNLKANAIDGAWITYRPKYGPLSLIEEAATSGSLEKMFQKAVPKEYHYKELAEKVGKYVEIQKNGGWAYLPIKGTLKLGKAYDVVPLLRERLRISGDYTSCENETNVYTKCMKTAVAYFQKRHGLIAKGNIGKKTIAALNVPVEKRIEQMRLNLDRIKWLHERNEKRHVMINIPAFTLFFEEDKKLIQEMRVIIGKRKNPTPIFSDVVETIVLNPYWNIPKSIIQKEMIPKLLRNPNAMAKKGIEIYTGWGKDAKKISGGSVDWSQYRYSKTMPFRFAQVPGRRNALGKVKFLFPNSHAVYMHDTPNKKLFNRNVRAFSHGCIRLHKPRELLRTFSTFNTTIDFDKSQKRLKGKKKSYLKLEKRVAIDVVYLTAYVDYNNVLQFRNDIYGYDKMQLQSYRKW